MRDDNSSLGSACHFGWGENPLDVPNYFVHCAELAVSYMQSHPKTRALDVGCSIGRGSFELARTFDEVIGVDLSAHAILEAQRLKESGTLSYALPLEGELTTPYEVKLNKFGLEHASKKVNFWQGDACALKPLFTDFDLVFAINLLDRLYDPLAFLTDITHRMRKDGMLMLSSVYDWRADITPKEKWLGGYEKAGVSVTTMQALEKILSPHFRLVDVQDVPYVKCETARTYRYAVAQMSIWQRR